MHFERYIHLKEHYKHYDAKFSESQVYCLKPMGINIGTSGVCFYHYYFKYHILTKYNDTQHYAGNTAS